MIKLINIIKEIKVTPNITPEMIYELYREISNKNLGTIPERQDIVYRYLKSGSLMNVKEEIKEMSKNELLALYKDLIAFKQKYEKND